MTTGPSTTQTPYLVAYEPNVHFTSILSAGDIVGTKSDGVTPWKFAGIPDGLGAFDNGDGTMTVIVNQEIGNTLGVIRDSGLKGAFDSKLIIDKATLQVVHAGDLDQHVYTDASGTTAVTAAFSRFCSGDLAAPSAYYNAATGLGTTARIYLRGEESGADGRAVASVVSGAGAGNAYVLSALGHQSFENLVANSFTGDKTVVLTTDDQSPGGQVYLYVGDKQATGNDVEKAGLTNGHLYGIKVPVIGNNTTTGAETAATHFTGGVSTFTLSAALPNGATTTGAQIESASDSAGVSEFFRPEDIAWDPTHANWAYFVTTATINDPSRLYRLEFTDISNPTAGGTISMLLDGTEGQKMLDNISVNADGTLVLLEDVGNAAHTGKVWHYDPTTDVLNQLAAHDVARFGSPTQAATAPFNVDEEASGVIDVTALLGSEHTKAFLLDTQAHYGIPGEVVEGGQLQVMYIDDVRDGGNGNDVLNGDALDNTISGNRGDDTINGGSGNDHLFGNRGADVLDGSRGSDVLEGGLDGDTFVFNSTTAGATDYVTDFQVSNDNLSFGLGVTVTAVSVGYQLGGTTFNGIDLHNGANALDLAITLHSAAGDQTLFILDAYNAANDGFWEAELGLSIAYPTALVQAANIA